MTTDSIEFGICPNCGSTEYIKNYPFEGKRICTRCGHENVKKKLKILRVWQETSNHCPSCGKKRDEDETIFDENDILVLKCKKCEELDGYEFPDFSGDYYYFDYGSHDPLSANCKSLRKWNHLQNLKNRTGVNATFA